MWGRRKAPVQQARVTDLTPHVEAARAGLESELTVIAREPGSWVPAQRTDPAAERMRRSNALHRDAEILARLL